MLSAQEPSISIGALTVQPGGTGVLLAGTGDPNDALDSYYGAGILRSADGGNSWSLTQQTPDGSFTFLGEGFAGFVWSSLNPQLVIAAVSQAYEGTLTNALRPGLSYEGLYYSSDAGVTWNLATISDGKGANVQGPDSGFAAPDGNAATSVVWNPVRQLFIAAVRFHGYYQSSDGVTWTRIKVQPGAGLTTAACPTNSGGTGSVDCPIFRGTLAVNPQTGDTFAWTVDLSNQDQGLWQDVCARNGDACSNTAIAFGRQWNTSALESTTADGAATILNGDYTLALAAVPAALGPGQDTWLFAGADDLWKCSLAAGCVWRNTTNATACMTAKVAGFQHALAWSSANPEEILIGNDSGLWRSLDAVGETGPVCSSSDATHFQNLNGGLGSLAEVESLAATTNSPSLLIAGLGVNGTTGLNTTAEVGADWQQILAGYGGPVAIAPQSIANWYVNDQNGVAIHLCSNPPQCDAASFGSSPIVSDADVGGDGSAMLTPAPFIVDPLDPTQLLVATCRVWRGPASGNWSAANMLSPILDSGATSVPCAGHALIRSIAALPIAGGGEVLYVGTYGALNNGENLPGRILSATLAPAARSMPVWRDLTLNPVTNSPDVLNKLGLDISSIFVDAHDPTGNTVYLTVEGILDSAESEQTVYGSTDGGAHWAVLTANLPASPANSLVIDPQNANTAYIATDAGVYFTTSIASCASLSSTCWSPFGSGLPEAPVVALTTSSLNSSAQVLTAGTYGRGIWQAPLWSAQSAMTTMSASPDSLTFASQVYGTTSNPKTITLTNSGTAAFTVTEIQSNANFGETDTCQGVKVSPGASCAINVTFTPLATGALGGPMTIFANVSGGQLSVALSGLGAAAGAVTLTPASINFGPVPIGADSSPVQIQVANAGESAVSVTSIAVTAPFTLNSNSCGVTSLAAESSCQLTVVFKPTQAAAATGLLSLIDGAGTQTVALAGTGAAPPTDKLSPASIAFPATPLGQLSASQSVLLTNAGDSALTGIAITATGPFQDSNACGTQLSGHATCTISVVSAPQQLGTQTGTLSVSDAMHIQTVTLSGSGVQPATLAANPASLNFSNQNVGVASLPQTVTVSNTGSSSAANVGFQLSGSAAASFTTSSTICAVSLAAGANCTVQVTFTPVIAGGNSATLTVSSSTLGVAPVVVSLNGAAQTQSGLNASPTQLNFPATLSGSSSAAQSVTVSNTSSVVASPLALSVTGSFSLVQNGCSNSLAAQSSCTVGVVFAPTTAGPAIGVLTASSPTIANTAMVQLAGTGTIPAGIQVTPSTLSFPTTGVGETSSPITITIANTGAIDALESLALAVPAGFRLSSNSCASTLAPETQCTAAVAFSPIAAGTQSGNLSVTTSTLAQGALVPLQGAGFDFTVSFSGSGSQTVTAGQAASYALVLAPLENSLGLLQLRLQYASRERHMHLQSVCGNGRGRRNRERVPANLDRHRRLRIDREKRCTLGGTSTCLRLCRFAAEAKAAQIPEHDPRHRIIRILAGGPSKLHVLRWRHGGRQHRPKDWQPDSSGNVFHSGLRHILRRYAQHDPDIDRRLSMAGPRDNTVHSKSYT